LLSGFGAAFLSEISIQQELKQGELVKVPVVGFTVQREFWMVTRSRRTASPAAVTFTALMQECFAGAGTG
jgi:DNA-binding transcriptional LysR family regulator